MNDNRKLDVTIAKLLGLEVLGEAPCIPGYCKSDSWDVAYDGDGQMQPVYLKSCFCDDIPLEDELEYFGHVASCLEPVPFYHQDDTLARRALEQICNGSCAIDITYTSGKWHVALVLGIGYKPFANGYDESLSLAICKALAKLKNNE